MTSFNKKAPWILLAGDLAALAASLWLALLVRTSDAPTEASYLQHLEPFSLLFAVSVLSFFISGLYDKQAVVLRSRLPAALGQAQTANALIAAAFFYLIPWYAISPKTTLFLYVVISLCLVLLWRSYLFPLVAPRSRDRALLVGGREEAEQLAAELSKGDRYGLTIAAIIDLDAADKEGLAERIIREAEAARVTVAVVDMFHEKAPAALPHLYSLIFRGVRFIEMKQLYEDVFDRVPLSMVEYSWFIENVSAAPKAVYDAMKRAMDVVVALVLGVLSLPLYPIVALAIRLEDRGPVFIFQRRVGRGGKIIRISKFRSMSVAAQDERTGASKPQSVTRVGAFIRKTRIDELPQLWNVVRGDLSLIGPRPELPQFVERYERDIPFYGVRHIIKPGLSGWAQLYHTTPPKFDASSTDTAAKLSYDLYYVKHRSLLLDIAVALKTVKELVSRRGV